MRQLHVISGLGAGGAERALFNLLAGGLAAPGEAMVLSLLDRGCYGDRLEALGIEVRTLDLKSPGGLAVALPRTRRLVDAFRPDLIQGWLYHGNLAATLAARVARRHPALVWNVRNCLYSLSDWKLLTQQIIRISRALSANVDAVIYNSELARQQHEAFGFRTDVGHLIPNGFDVDALRPDAAVRLAERLALDVSGETVLIGHVARFHPVKDHASFLRAAVRVAEARPRIEFLLAGMDVSVDNPALARRVPPRLSDRFHFLGLRNDIHRLMQALDVLCQSSWSEAFPNVLGEAMALGIPCVATAVGDSRSILGDCGVLVPPRDSDALARGMIRLADMAPTERRRLGMRARSRVTERFALPAIVARYARLYQRLMAQVSPFGRSTSDNG